MRWLWRIVVLFLLLSLFKIVWVPQPRAFIAWPERNSMVDKIKWDWRRWQEQVQDLPASIEVEMRRLWQDYKPNSDGKPV
ncbi:MAG: hypothetical protein ACYCVD_01655 [Desulfitobacteriaceae bacterium]